jgi:hypothetical protein
MTTARLALLLGFSWSVTATALRLRPVPEAPRPPDPISTTTPVTLAAEILRHTDRFASVGVGPAGITSTQALAWRVISQSPVADSVFQSLLQDATRPGQLYALAGLFVTDQATYVLEAARQRAKGGEASAQFGCIVSCQPVATILDDMDSGRWSGEFLVGRPRLLTGFVTTDPR